CLQLCIDQIQTALHFAIEKKFVDPQKVAIAGLSRGGLIAAFAAAEEPLFRHLLAFAPVTELRKTKEFLPLQDSPLVRFYDAKRLAPLLANRRIRIYIGNRDERVSTKDCFDFTMELVEKAHAARVRPAQIELIITPSLGHMGHGTSPNIFHQGAQWLIEQLH
ncbi:MAG: esterase family protein, partial [Chlamydiales bacterium]|nr:esterase family protein [Chlamydiales bacterium]